jgi:hypothetical protein
MPRVGFPGPLSYAEGMAPRAPWEPWTYAHFRAWVRLFVRFVLVGWEAFG